MEVYSQFNPSEVYNISIPTHTPTATILFTCTLPGGLFAFRFYYTQYGYAICSDTQSITIPRPSLPASLLSSYKGSYFAITGTGLSPSATLTVNGLSTTLADISSSAATASVPAFVTTLPQDTFALTSPSKVSKKQFSIVSD